VAVERAGQPLCIRYDITAGLTRAASSKGTSPRGGSMRFDCNPNTGSGSPGWRQSAENGGAPSFLQYTYESAAPSGNRTPLIDMIDHVLHSTHWARHAGASKGSAKY
jgi:hypothetical protein